MPLSRKPRVNVQDEGVDQGKVFNINFAGAGVSLAASGDVGTATIAGGGGGSPGGNVGEIQYNNSGSFAGMSLVETDGNYLMFISSSVEGIPSVTDAGKLKLFNRDLAGRQMLAMRGPSGIATALQPIIARNGIGIWVHPGSSTAAPTAWGIAAPTNSGTLTSRAVTSTNTATMTRRVGAVSAATAGNMCGFRLATAQYSMASGFTVFFRFFNSDAASVANARLWVGMTSVTTAFTGSGAHPSSFNNAWGIGADGGQTNLAVMSRGATVATTASLGDNFPANTKNLDLYEVAMFCPPSGSTIGWRVERINTGHVVAGSITTNLPTSTTLLAPQLWRGNGSTALAVGLDIVSLYLETDN